MFVINENDREYRFGDSGPKYLMKGPRMNFALVAFQPGQDFQAHYHNVMEENFFVLEGKVDIVVDGTVNTLTQGRTQQGVIFFFDGKQLGELAGGLSMRGRLVRNPGMVVESDGSMGVF